MSIQPGIYDDMSEDDYFAADDYVSCSKLKTYLPEHFRPFSGSSYADVGSALHGRVLGRGQPESIHDFATWTSKAAIEAQNAARTAGIVPVLLRDVELLEGMEKALQAHPEASRLLYETPGTPELSVFTTDGQKARLDRLNDDGWVIDLKKTKERPSRDALTRAVINYGYDLQRVHYGDVCAIAGIHVEGFRFVFVCDTDPFPVTVVELDQGFIDRGWSLKLLAYRRLLDPQVPRYEGAVETLELSLPKWARL